MPDPIWYLNRLRTMSAKELRYRVFTFFLKKFEKIKWTLKNLEYFKQKFYEEKSKKVNDETLSYFLKHLRQLFPFQTDKNFFIRNYSKSDMPSNEKEKTFPIFEQLIEITQNKIDWHKDYKTGRDWPLIYSDNIDIRDATKVGEVDYVWRINRCQHLTWQAQSYFLKDNSILMREVLSEIEMWIGCNPYRKGVNWINSMEMAIRCISWIIALAFLTQKENLPQMIVGKIVSSIVEQIDYIDKHLSRFSSANNHLIVELTGLITFGLIFGEEFKGKKWLKCGLRELQKELEKQTFSDGVNKEQSIHYHSLVLDCLLWIIILFQRCNVKIPKTILTCAEAMCNFLCVIIDSNGNVPAIGDSDDGYLFWLADMKKLNNFQSQLATGAVLFNRSDFKSVAKNFDEKSFWLLGSQGYKKFREIINFEKIPESKAFLDAGYYVLKSGRKASELLLVFDCGSLGYPSTAAHGHADALSIWLSIGGSQVLVDSGTYSYLLHPEWREYFRGTSAHNTAVINGSNQSETGGPYIWINKPISRCENWFKSSVCDYVVGSHDGYLKRHKVRHSRRILFIKPVYWIIEDYFAARSKYDVELFFHFFPGQLHYNSSKTTYSCNYITKSGNVGLDIILPKSEFIDISDLHSDNSNMLGWISPKYGIKKRSPILSIKIKSVGFNRFSYLLVPVLKKNSATEKKKLNFGKQLLFRIEPDYKTLNIYHSAYQDTIYFTYSTDIMLQLGELILNAQTIIIRSNYSGIIESVILISPSRIKLIGQKERKFPPNLNSFYLMQTYPDNSSILSLDTIGFDSKVVLPNRDEVAIERY